MLPRKYRLPLKTEFERIKKEGKLFPGKFFGLLIAPGPATRFAFIVSKKVHHRATKRNRSRRLLVEAIRAIIPKIKPGFDHVFLVKSTIVGQELPAVKAEVEKILLDEKNYSFFN